MGLEHYYPYSISQNFLDFIFESDGPNGKIIKVVRYSPQNADGMTYFNLGFGDLNSATGKVDDISISDNRDTDKLISPCRKGCFRIYIKLS